MTPSALLRNLLHFVRILRGAGLDVPAGAALVAAQALEHMDLARRADVRLALRSVLIHRRDDLEPFDYAFDAFFRPRVTGGTTRDLRALGERRHEQPPARAVGTDAESGSAGVGGALASATPASHAPEATYSAREALRRKDFAEFTPEEAASAQAFLDALTWTPDRRRTRRWAPSRPGRLDLSRLVRRSLRYGGEIVDLPRRVRQETVRPLVVLCDVSGSMEPYSRMLLQFVHAVARSRRRVEVFLFATRLSRITRDASRRHSRHLTSRLPILSPDWAGGTRIGEALRHFHIQWARRVMRHGPVVLIVSDGWDRGEPLVLKAAMSRLQRLAHRVIWLNPLLGDADYQPLTRGMRAALPYVDDFLPVHNLDSLVALAARLNQLPARPDPRQRRAWLARTRDAGPGQPSWI